MADEKQVLLSVQHLQQFFKMGRQQLKAVNDISFDIYKGEVFGLVGESGNPFVRYYGRFGVF